MKRFLWLVVALATMVLVGCSNNAGGGGDSPKEGGSSNWWIGTWQGENITKGELTISQKIEINADGSWKMWLTDVNSGTVYDYFSSTPQASSMGYSVKGTYEMQSDDFTWSYDDDTTEVFGAGLYLKTDQRTGADGLPTTKFKESRFFYDGTTGKVFFLTSKREKKDIWTKMR